MLSLLTVILISYLIGSIPSSLWIGRIFANLDIRDHGSGNAGATNTFRVLGWKAGLVVLFLDFLKGLAATTLVVQLAWVIGSGPVAPTMWDTESFLKITCGVVAVIGHMYSAYASFTGGKGAATAAGMLYGIEPISITISLVVFVSVIYLTRYVSLGTITGTFIYPIIQLVLIYGLDWPIDPSVLIFTSALAIFIIVKHRSNIRRLWKGEENKLEFDGASKPRKEEPKSNPRDEQAV